MGTIFGNGLNQEDEVTLLKLIETNFAGLMTKLDADTGDTTWATTYATTLDPSVPASGNGLSQAIKIDFLSRYITNWNLLLAALDTDDGVATTTYRAGAALTVVIDSVSAGNLYQNGVNQSHIVKLYNDIITNFAACTDLLDADGTLTDVNYGTLWDIPDTVDETGTTEV